MPIYKGHYTGLTKKEKRLSIALSALRKIAPHNNYSGQIARQALKDCAEVKNWPRPADGTEKEGA